MSDIYDLPPTRTEKGQSPLLPGGYGGSNANGKKKNSGSAICCGPGWQLTALFWIGLLFFGSFLGLMIGVIANKDVLEQTGKATVSMHKDTVELRSKIEAAVKDFSTKFPSNQVEITVSQVLDSISRSHELVVWVDQISKGIPPGVIAGVAKNADAFISNATAIMEVFGSAVRGGPKQNQARAIGSKQEPEGMGFGPLIQKTMELLNGLNPKEFHDVIVETRVALSRFVKMTDGIKPEKLAKLVNSLADIVSAAETDHIIDSIAKLSKGAGDVIRRFSQPGGLTLSLPLDSPVASPQAAAGTPQQHQKK